MALDAELINLKSAGTYRFERDKSEISNDMATISNMRLVVGFSKQGPFNTVKLVTSPAQFIKLYGNIDRSLEKRGSFFHRSALAALSVGPILCLNLLNLDPDVDQVVEKSFSVSSDTMNKDSVTLPLQTLYNSDKFWYASEDAYLDSIEKYLGKTIATVENEDWSEGILHFTNISKKPLSILVKKASDYATKGYELTLNEWYGEGNVPEYLNGTSYVSDYMVEVYVVGGDFGPAMAEPSSVVTSIDLDDDHVGDIDGEILKKYVKAENDAYKRFSSDIVYQSYFDEDGFIRGENDANLNKFLRLPSVNLRAKYVGSLIPNFVDKLGRNIWIQKLVNDDVDTIGILCVENVALIEDVDLDEEFVNEKIDIIGHNVYANIKSAIDDKTISDMKFDFLSYGFDYTEEGQIISVNGVQYQRPNNANNDKDADGAVSHPFAWVNVDDESKILYADATRLKVGDYLYRTATEKTYPVQIKESGLKDVVKRITVTKIISDSTPVMTEFTITYGESDSETLYTTSNNDNRVEYIPRDNEVILDSNADIVVGDYLVSYLSEDATKSRLTRVVEIRNVFKADADGKLVKAGALVICADKVLKSAGTEDNMVVKINPIDKIAKRLQWVCLNGFNMRKELMPNGTNGRQNMILDMLREEPRFPDTVSNLFKTLIDRDYVQWRYLVDTFGLGIEEECKSVYTHLCDSRKSGFAIVNCPSQLDFKKSINPSFTNKMGGVEVEFIAKGGDQSKNPSFLFSLPTIENGASWGAYYYPYLRISDLGAVKSVPPAAYVSNLYILKYTRGFAWSIVAGQKRGVISGNQVIGVEATLVHDNRDWLEPAGINPIIWEQGVGVEIYANKTAKQTPVSALSSAHVREAAIYIQDGVESILRKYVFEFNTAQTRMEIKTLVDEFLNTMKNNGGLYDFRTVMDTSNNTTEVIDNNMGVIDIYVEIVRGLEIIAQRLTILRTGAISAGGFE